MSEIDHWVDQSSSWVTLIGFLIGLFGVFLTYKQARDARLAAQDAKLAAEAAGRKVIGFDASVSLYGAIEVLHRIMDLISNAEWTEANLKCIDVRKILERAISANLEAVSSNPQVGALASYLDVLINNVLTKLSDPMIELNIVEIQRDLVAHIVAMTGLCETLRQREVIR